MASAGQVLLEGRDITAWPQPQRARGGLGRSYQRSTIFPTLSVYENCRLAEQAGRQRFWHWWRSAEHTSELQSLMRISYAVFCLKKKNKPPRTARKTDPEDVQDTNYNRLARSRYNSTLN